MKLRSVVLAIIFASILFAAAIAAQKPSTFPVVKKIDETALKQIIKPAGKPLLINFWATWCEPCREEFPDLVKLSEHYDERIDVITVSLDDLAEINTSVPKFLSEMKAEMPAYLLKAADENAAILSVAKDWQGGLPFTILFDEDGSEVYCRQGKFSMETVAGKINGLLGEPAGLSTQ